MIRALLLFFVAIQIAPAPISEVGACGLVTPAELQPVLGAKIALKPKMRGEVQTCSGQTATASVIVRLFRRTGNPDGVIEPAGIAAAKKMGAQVDMSTLNGITCLMVRPPRNVQMGYLTSCTVIRKKPMYAVIEITADTRVDMVTIDRLFPVAEKMATRY
jgi:hypothetical protein